MATSLTGPSATAWLRDFADVVHDRAAELTELDAAIGDADHGGNLDRGMRAVAEQLAADPSEDKAAGAPGAVLKQAAMTLVRTVGGASGPLYGTFFLRLAGALGDADEVAAKDFGSALRAGVDGVLARGKAAAGDKTMIDAWLPALAAYDEAVEAGAELGAALEAAAVAAEQGRDATVAMVARKGRASYLGERSAGHADPGATSTALLLRSAARTL